MAAADGYKAIRVRESTHEELMRLKAHIKRLGINGLPPALRQEVTSISDVLDLMAKATRKVIG